MDVFHVLNITADGELSIGHVGWVKANMEDYHILEYFVKYYLKKNMNLT